MHVRISEILNGRLFRILFPVMLLFSWNTGEAQSFDFQPFQDMLDDYRVENCRMGNMSFTGFDYRRLAIDSRSPLSSYRKQRVLLADFDPQTLSDREEQLAFWINAYNFGTIAMVVEHWRGVRDKTHESDVLSGYRKVKDLTIGDRQYSLDEIRESILSGRLQEPLAFFSLCDATVSSPDLAAKIYISSPQRNRFSGMMVDPAQLIFQLRRQARLFFGHTEKGLKIDQATNRVFFPRIFQDAPRFFPGGVQGAIPLIASLLENKEDAAYLLSEKYEISVFEFNHQTNSADLQSCIGRHDDRR